MPKIKLMQGNFLEILEKSELNSQFCKEAVASSDFDKQLAVILADLPRVPFLPTENFTFKDFVSSWLNHPTLDKYLQGDMESGIAEMLLKMYLLGPGISLEEDEKIEKYGVKCSSLRFGYFNDKRQLCGLCVAYFKSDPQLWVIGDTQNAIAAPENREVLFLLNENSQGKADGLVDSAAATTIFLNHLNSKRIAEFMQGVILEDGAVSLHQLKFNRKKIKKINSIQQAYADTIGTMKINHEILKKEKPLKMAVYNHKIAQITNNIDEIKSTYPEKITQLHQEYKNKSQYIKKLQKDLGEQLKNPQLEKRNKQSLIRRNASSFINLSLISLASICLTLVYFNLIPLLKFGGILMLGLSPHIIFTAIIGILVVAALFTAIKIFFDYVQLNDYQQLLSKVENTFEQEINNLKKSSEDTENSLKTLCLKGIDELENQLELEVTDFINCSQKGADIQEEHKQTCKKNLTTLIEECRVNTNEELSTIERELSSDSIEHYLSESDISSEPSTPNSTSIPPPSFAFFLPQNKAAIAKEDIAPFAKRLYG